MVSKTTIKKPGGARASVKGPIKPGGKRPPVKPLSASKGKPGAPGKVSGN